MDELAGSYSIPPQSVVLTMATKLAPLAAAAGNIPFLAKAKPHAIVMAIFSNGTNPSGDNVGQFRRYMQQTWTKHA